MSFIIYTDNACDLPVNLIKKHNISSIPIKVSFDRETMLSEGENITIREFYDRLKSSDVVPKTYYPTVRDYVTELKKGLDQGMDVLCICMSSKLSKGYFNALNAKKILEHTYKKNKVLIMDSTLASGGQGLFIIKAAGFRDQGLNIDTAFKQLTEISKSAYTILTISSLDQLAKGGRMSKSTAALGKLLHINPIIYLENGQLVSKDKAIGRKKALSKIVSLILKEINDKTADYDFVVFHSQVRDEAEKIESQLKSEYNISFNLPVLEIGTTIGSHTGESVISISCMKKKI